MATQVQFTLNGELKSVDVDEAAGKTLNEYIRSRTQYTGTKVSCAQGGCGACTVAVARPTEPLKSVPSCLTPLASLHGAAVVTVEGLSAADGAPHPVAERLAKMGGSQCGFCTPGMVMQIFSTLSRQDGGQACGERDLEQCINGNICRCTGYRPIVDCAKSFAADTTVKSHIDPSVPLGPYDAAVADPKLAFPPDAAALAGKQWLQPKTVAEAVRAMSSGASPIAGGSAAGIYSDLALATSNAAGKVWVDLNGVQELAAITAEGGNVKIGSTVTWSRFTEFMQGLAASGKAPNSQALKEFADRTGSIAGAQVRNLGTIGGNIAITRNKGFLSDWVPLLAALGAKVVAIGESGRPQEEDILGFVQKPEPFAGLISAVLLPLPSEQVVFKSFRVAKRSRNAHALVNAGFAASIAGGKLGQVSVVLGAVDPKPCRLKNLERALGHTSVEELQSGLPSALAGFAEKVGADLFPMACEFGREQTAHIVCGFVVKFLAACFGSALPKEWQTAEYCLHDMERSSSTLQAFPTPTDVKGPMNKPIPKTSAIEQTTGRAKYTDDVPKPEGMLSGAFVMCHEANVVVKDIDLAPAKQMLGDSFHSFVVAEDLSVCQVDLGELFLGSDLPPAYKEDFNPRRCLLLPKGEATPYGGMPVGVLLARGDSPRLLEQAAAACSAKLTIERCGPVAMGDMANCKEVTCEPIVMHRGKKPAKEVVADAKEGKRGLACVSGRIEKQSQSHFYMENQSCISIPDEGGITCYSASQAPDAVQRTICAVTGLAQHQVVVSMRRAGGGFGGKGVYPGFLSALASAIALQKQLPVRIVPSREQDMCQVGGRQEIEGTWEAAVEKNGKIVAVDYNLWFAHSAAGNNIQKLPVQIMGGNIDSVYSIPSVACTARLAQQHVPERTAVRAPGAFEGAILAEAVMDGVAASLKMPGRKLREINMCRGRFNSSGLNGGLAPPGSMPGNSSAALWEALKEKVGYEAREKAVDEFNKGNTWKKRGLSMTVARYGIFHPPGCMVRVDLFKDGSLQIACNGCEIGQGLHTKVGQMVSTVLERALGAGPPLGSMRFTATSTEQMPNGAGTGGSTTSLGNMMAAGDAAKELAKRLKPFVKAAKKVAEPSEKGPWFDIVRSAFSNKIMGMLLVTPNVSVVGMHYVPMAEMIYETYGVGAAEVELDVLTGESRILMAHLLFDVGMSANPMLDIGQMEGAFVMGCGQMMQEGVDFDRATGRLLTDNTWTYKPPIACDIPETFKVELMDMRKKRLNNPVTTCLTGVMFKLMGAMGFPWTPTKTDEALKSSKAISEPPLLLCLAPHSALADAMVAATGGPLPDNKMPIPAKPFKLLPLLHAQKPGSGGGPDDTSTATGTSVSTQNPGN